MPRLPTRLEYLIARSACGLPSWAQRRLFGQPPEIDGQVLASDMQALLRLAALIDDTSLSEGRTPDEARAHNEAAAKAVAGPPRPMAAVEELEIPGPKGPIPARLYTPLDPLATPRPVIVYFHGGGWVVGSIETHDSVCRFLAANVGAPVLSVDYRLAPEHPFPAGVEDSFAAFHWATEHGPSLGFDPARIAVAGDSGGGNLAAAVSLLAHAGGGRRPAMQLLFYPATEMGGKQRSRELFAEGFLLTRADMDWFESHYLTNDEERSDPRASVGLAADLSGLPPTYVATAGFDPLRDEGEQFAERARAAGVPVALHRHSNLIHGFANMTAVSRTARSAMHEAAGALRMGLT